MYDILLINAHRQYEALGREHLCDWIGIYQLATFMDKNGYPARAFSGYTHEVEAMLEKEMTFGIKVVGFTCDYENQREVESFCRLVSKRWGVPTIVGGPQAVALGEEFLRLSGAFAVVRGEGELPLLALMQLLVDGSGKIERIPSLAWLSNGTLQTTPQSPPISNLDGLPFIDSSLILGRRFRKHTASILTARGCPFRCAFCYEGANTRGVRWRSVSNVMAELRQIMEENPNLRFILFTDDTFTLNTRRVREFTEAFSEYRKERDFVWFAEAHPQTILHHPELLPMMVEAGLFTLQIGVESGSEKTLKAYNKKTTPDIIEKAVIACRESGVPHVVANIIVGGALDDRENIAKSKAFGLHLLDIAPGIMELFAISFWPLPNTAMTTNPDKYGIEILDSQSLTSITDYPVVRCGNLGPEELSALRQDMTEAFSQKITELLPRISEEMVIRLLTLNSRYGARSSWIDALLQVTRFRRYVGLLHSGAIRRSRDISPEEFPLWHPQRMCSPVIRNGKRFAEDVPLSDELFQVFIASSGKMSTIEAASYCSMNLTTFIKLAIKLESLLIIGFCRY